MVFCLIAVIFMKYLSTCWLVFLFACGGESSTTTCNTDRDCFSGEVCRLGKCGTLTVNNANNLNNANNANNQNNGNNRSGACIVDPFGVSCEDDGNDTFGETIDNAPKGCNNAGEFVPWETMIDARMCGLEMADKYRQSLLPCDDVSFILDITFTPDEPCDSSLYEIDLGAQGSNCIEGGDDIQCMTMEDGSVHASIIVRPSNSLGSSYFNIEKDADASDVDFEYTLTVAVRQ